MRFEFLIGLRYLRARRQERFVSLIAIISLAGVMLGTFALTVDLAVMSGFEEDLHKRLLAFTPHLTIQAPQDAPVSPALEARIRSMTGVAGAAPYVSGQVLLASSATSMSAGYVKSGGVMRGVVAPDNPVLAELSHALTPGALPALGTLHPVTIGSGADARKVDLPAAILGKGLAEDLDGGLCDAGAGLSRRFSFGVSGGCAGWACIRGRRTAAFGDGRVRFQPALRAPGSGPRPGRRQPPVRPWAGGAPGQHL